MTLHSHLVGTPIGDFMHIAVLVLLVLTISMEVAREVCFKLAANKSDAQLQNSSYLLRLFGTPLIWAGFACWGVELISWIMVLAHMKLSIAFPLLSLCYCGMILASKFILNEPVSKRKWLGVALITAGIALIGLQGGG